MWTSYLPLHKKALEWIEKGRVGQVKYVTANLGYEISNVPRLNSTVLGGGSYLDLGVYTTNFALSFMGDDIKVSRVFARKVSSGIDRDTTYSMETEDGAILGNFYVTMCADTDRDGVIIGERGKIKLTNINNYRKITLYSTDDVLLDEIETKDSYLKGYVDPVPVMLPINILSEVATPVSMSLRHFGNVVSGMVITSLLYFALSAVTKAIGVAFLTIGIPAVLSLYFDLFSGFMQAFVFIMLTMAYISNADGRNEA